MENEKVAKKKTADILLELFEWCVGHTEVYPCAGCSQQLLIRMRKGKKREDSEKSEVKHGKHGRNINCTGQPRHLCLLLHA